MSSLNQSAQNVSTIVENEFRWQTLLTQVKQPLEAIKVIQKDDNLNFKFEKCLIDFLKKLTPSEQKYVEEHTLTNANIQPPTLSIEEFNLLKHELKLKEQSIEKQLEYCDSLPFDDKRVQWLTKLASTGDINSQNALAHSLRQTKNYKECLYWSTKTASRGSKYGRWSLGTLLQYGYGDITKDFKKAVEYYSSAAEEDYSPAQNALGLCYQEGQGVEKDLTKSVYWFTRASQITKYYPAQSNLGVCYLFGKGIEKDEKKGFVLITESANNNIISAQIILGKCYEKGTGTLKNMEEAFSWYSRAAVSGSARAQYELAIYFKKQKDMPMAFEWASKAAHNGFAKAQDTLGTLYRKGLGTSINMQLAGEWYSKASAQGYLRAKTHLEKLVAT